MSRYLVTGATGLLGAHLVRLLVDLGHEVVALARSVPSGPAEEALRGARFVAGDVLDPSALRGAAEGCDGAFHGAGLVSRRAEDAELLHRVHVEGTRAVVRACREAGVRRLVLASTSGTVAVSESAEKVATEEDEAPLSLVYRFPYYRSKLFAERAALSENGPGLEVVSVNPSLLLGPGDTRGSSTEEVRLMLEGRLFAVPPGGLSFVDARDAAEAMRLAMGRGRPGERYLVGACNLSFSEFFARLARISGAAAPSLNLPALARRGAPLLARAAARLGAPTDGAALEMGCLFWYLDASKAERELGWRPRDPSATLADTVEDLRARGAVWPRAEA